VQTVAGRVKDGDHTRMVYDLAMKLLDEQARPIAARYNLRKAILQLGPTGFPFEKYIAEVLRIYGYETELPEILTGACITHEVDVLAKKDMRRSMIECKFRNESGIYIGVKDVMSTWTRFLDLVEGAELGNCPHMDEAWLVTNTRFSSDGLKFAHCKGMILIGWNHPEERSLAHMIDAKAVYPVTVLHKVDPQTLTALAKGQVLLLKQLVDGDAAELAARTNLPAERIKTLAREAKDIVNL
jgi:Holliday junction resolvase